MRTLFKNKLGGKIFGKYTRRSLVVASAAIAAILILGGGSYALFFAGGSQPSDSSSVNLQKGLVGYWPFNGNAKDATPYGNNGTVNGAVLTADRFGHPDNAYSFNGTDSTITIPDDPNLRLNGSFTVSFWYQDNGATGTYPGIISQGTSHIDPGEGWAIFYAPSSGKLAFKRDNITYGSDANQVNSNPHLYTITYDGSEVFVYVDTAQVTYGFPNYAKDTSTTGLNIGGGNDYAKGILDDLRIYDRAINADEVKALYNGVGSDMQVGGLQGGLVGHWKFDGNLKDSTPYGDDCTIPYSSLSYGNDERGRANSSLYTIDVFDEERYADCGQPSTVLFGQKFTISAWTKSTQFQSGAGSSGIFGYGSCGFFFDSSGHLEAVLDNAGGGNTAFTTSQTYGVNQWYFVTLSYDGSTVKMYVDGNQVYSQSFTDFDPVTSPGAEISIGNWSNPSSTRNFIGYMDDVRAYNRALSASEVSQIYNSYDSQINLGGSGNGGSVNLTKGLVGYWPFSGNAKDATPYGNNGTVNGATLTADRFGRGSSAYSFNGSSDYIGLDAGKVGKPASVTVSAWVKPATSGSDIRFVVTDAQEDFSDGWSLYQLANGQLVFHVAQDSSVSAEADTPPLSVGQWCLVTGVYDASTKQVSIYDNGQYVKSGTLSGTMAYSDDRGLAIGRQNKSFGQSTRYFDGSVDDVRIYNRALSAVEVQALYDLRD